MRPLRLGPTALDLLAIGVGATLTALFAKRASDAASLDSLVPLLALLFFLGLVTLTVAAPHWLIAGAIPLFAAIPMLKILVAPWIGPLKDAVTVAMVVGAALLVVNRRNQGQGQRGDHAAILIVAALLGLYVINLGGRLQPGAYGGGWMQGVRLTAEPLLLLVVGLTVGHAQKAFRWAIVSLIATGVGVALVGLWQQYVGQWYLVDLGYEFDVNVRTINGHLRSFGTLDDSFAYAALLLTACVAIAFVVRNRWWTVALLSVVLGGLAFGYVRTSAIILVALVGLWLARVGHRPVAFLVLAASVVAGVVVLLASAGASESRVVQTDQNTYLTINGRTKVWESVLRGPSDVVIGRGVGVVGTAADRASFGVVRSGSANTGGGGSSGDITAVDSGYLAAVVDVGIPGLILLLALLGRLAVLAGRAAQLGRKEGWVAAGMLVVLVLDAVTRASFTGFPTAFLGMLLVGLALNAATEADRDSAGPRARGAPD